MINFCTLSAGDWTVLSAVAILGGMTAGYVLQAVFHRSGFDLSSSAAQNLTGGCIAPVAIAALSGLGISKLLPDDPCGGAHTPDAIFVPPLLAMLVVVSALTLFWAKVWRR